MPTHLSNSRISRALNGPTLLHTPRDERMARVLACLASGQAVAPSDVVDLPRTTALLNGFDPVGWIGHERFGRPLYQRQGSVAIVDIDGPILERQWSILGEFFGLLSMEYVVGALHAVAEDPSIERVIYRMDCPGGSVNTIEGISAAMQRVREAGKTQEAFVDPVMASLAVWMGAMGDRVVASPGSLLGSIGIIHAMYDSSRAAEQKGIKPVVLATDKRKAKGLFGVPITEDMLDDDQALMDESYDAFVAAVATGRGMTEDDVRAIGARVMSAKGAVAAGLADEILTLEEMLGEAGTKARSHTKGTQEPRGTGARGRSASAVSSVHAVVEKEEVMPLTIEAIKADPAWNDVLALARNEVRGPLETEIRGQLAAEATAKANEPAAIDLLLSEFGGDDEGKVFAANAYAARMPMAKARSEFNKARDAKLIKAQTDLAEAQARLASLSPGEEPLATKPGGGGGQFKSYDEALLHFQSAAGGGMKRIEAIAHVNKTFPGLREAMVRGA